MPRHPLLIGGESTSLNVGHLKSPSRNVQAFKLYLITVPSVLFPTAFRGLDITTPITASCASDIQLVILLPGFSLIESHQH